MSVLSDTELMEYIRSGRLVVEPFDPEIVRENGLDLRLGNEVCEIAASGWSTVYVNAERDVSDLYECWTDDEEIVLGSGRAYLLTTVERIKLPSDLMGFVELRSTFARLGLLMPPTIVDAGFDGTLTIEVFVAGPTLVIEPGTRFLHVVFAKLTKPVTKPYSGRYLGQRGVTLPKLPL